MMTRSDYETLASALVLAVPTLSDRVRVYRRLVPSLIADNGKFNPLLFGESMKIPRLLCQESLTRHIKKEVGNDGCS